MGRNSEVIRQWTLLRELAGTRTSTISKLSEEVNVTTRTIRRDLAALQAAGCPVYALRGWILGFGRLVRVVTPSYLVDAIQEELDEARRQYESGGFGSGVDSDVQPALLFLFGRLASA